MNLLLIFLGIILCIFLTVGLIFMMLTYFIGGPYARYKRKTRFFTMEEIVSTITSVCNLQFYIYDNNRFREAGPKLNNTSFDNYYEELSRKCIRCLSDEFYEKASMYMKEDAIALMISEMVRNYLTSKIGIDESANSLEEEI